MIARREHWRVDACVTHQDCSEIHVSGESGATVLLSPFDRLEPVEPEGRLQVARLRRWWSHVNGLAAGIHVGRLHVGPARARILAYNSLQRSLLQLDALASCSPTRSGSERPSRPAG